MSNTIRHVPAMLAVRPRVSQIASQRCYTSWTAFEKPALTIPLPPPKGQAVVASTSKETPKTASAKSTGGSEGASSDVANHGNTSFPITMTGTSRVPSQAGNKSICANPYTKFRTGLWRDSHLPSLRLNLAGSPATFGVADSLTLSHSSVLAKDNKGPIRQLVVADFTNLSQHDFEKRMEEEMQEAERDFEKQEEEMKEAEQCYDQQKGAQEKEDTVEKEISHQGKTVRKVRKDGENGL
ncbi:hypothetical protein SUNI508_11868 [Seiridium unicorne]|uniref:Uncharacterized protein n=1 Tax=Seiridium unicorne TaxID=138068 RepID=A0ABR2UGQ4_9PEZI